MVLFLYVLMLLNLNKESEPHKSTVMKVAAVIFGGLIMVLLVGTLRGAEEMMITQTSDIGMVKTLGKVMFTKFLLPFEITSILLLAAMVGAVMIGKK